MVKQVGVPTKIYQPVGRCIFCGSEKGTMDDEHIIPFFLGGRLVLPNASCKDCAKKTLELPRSFNSSFLLGRAGLRLCLSRRRAYPRHRFDVEVDDRLGALEEVLIMGKDDDGAATAD